MSPAKPAEINIQNLHPNFFFCVQDIKLNAYFLKSIDIFFYPKEYIISRDAIESTRASLKLVSSRSLQVSKQVKSFRLGQGESQLIISGVRSSPKVVI